MKRVRLFYRVAVAVTVVSMFCFAFSAKSQELRFPTSKKLPVFPSKGSIVGTWLFNIDSGIEGIAAYQAIITFHRDGTVVASQNAIHGNSAEVDFVCGCNASSPQGVWIRTGINSFQVQLLGFVFAGPDTANFPINASETVDDIGQHIGFLRANAKVEVIGDQLEGINIGEVLNLDGDDINPDVPALNQFVTAERMTISRVR